MCFKTNCPWIYDRGLWYENFLTFVAKVSSMEEQAPLWSTAVSTRAGQAAAGLTAAFLSPERASEVPRAPVKAQLLDSTPQRL